VQGFEVKGWETDAQQYYSSTMAGFQPTFCAYSPHLGKKNTYYSDDSLPVYKMGNFTQLSSVKMSILINFAFF
jgi:hypothetical protein